MTTIEEARAKDGVLKRNPKKSQNEIRGRNRGIKGIENINDRPKLSHNLHNQFRRGYPPRSLVEPMHQGHWTTLDDWVDLEDLIEDE